MENARYGEHLIVEGFGGIEGEVVVLGEVCWVPMGGGGRMGKGAHLRVAGLATQP